MQLKGWHVPIETLSASAVNLLLTCPEQFRLRRIKREKETFGLERFLGSVDHEAHAANWGQKIVTGKDLNLIEMAREYDRVWEEEETQQEAFWLDEAFDFTEEKENAYELGVRMMHAYHEQVSPGITPLRVEERFEVQLPGVPIPLVGYADLETPDAIIERKTTSTKLSKPKPHWIMQAQIYGLTYDKKVDWHLVTRQKQTQIVTPTEAPGLRLENLRKDSTVLLIQQAAHTLNDLWVRYGADNPWPMNGVTHPFMCGYCSFKKKCVAWN